MCVRTSKLIAITVQPRVTVGGFPPVRYHPSGRLQGGDLEPPVRIPAGHLTAPHKKPSLLTLGGLTSGLGAADAFGPSARSASAGVSIRHTFDLYSGTTPCDTVLPGSETSVAYAPGGVVMYTANFFGAALSVDGGKTFTMQCAATAAGAASLFPYPQYSASGPQAGCFPICDQVVTYDPHNDMLIWVVQYPADTSNPSNNAVLIAYASPGALKQRGSSAWSYWWLNSNQVVPGQTFLDQPRLGFTPGYVYLSFNLPHDVFFRFPSTGFQDKRYVVVNHNRVAVSPGPLHAQLLDGGCGTGACSSLRIAQNVPGHREYLVGGGNALSSLEVASIDDSSNTVVSEIVPTTSRAFTNGANLANFGSIVPSGDDWLARDSTTVQNFTATVAGDGTIYAAWLEGRNLYNSAGQVVDINGNVLASNSTTYAQPHLGMTGFVDASFYVPPGSLLAALGVPSIPVFVPVYENEFVNPNYAFALPDLATEQDGDVAMGFSAGGGTNQSGKGAIYMVHGVGYLTGNQRFLTDARSDSFTADCCGAAQYSKTGQLILAAGKAGNASSEIANAGNVYGDYNTVRPLPAPYGNCLVSSSVVTQGGNPHPVITTFSRPGASCPPPPTTSTTLSVGCPTGAVAGQPAAIGGQLSPAVFLAPIVVTVAGGPGGSTQTVTSYTGPYTAVFTPGTSGFYRVTVSYGGNASYGASSNSCIMYVSAGQTPTQISLTCPAAGAVGSLLTVTGTFATQAGSGLSGYPIGITISGGTGGGTQAVTTTTGGAFHVSFTPGASATYTIVASYGATSAWGGSSRSCSVPVHVPAWGAPNNIDGAVSLSSVSCPTSSFCAAVDGTGDALTFNGTSWSAPGDIDGTFSFTSVSCTSSSFCIAVDNQGNYFKFNGQSWSAASAINVTTLTSVSCASPTFCVAIDFFGWLKYNGTSWTTEVSLNDNNNGLNSVSCPSSTFCVAVDGRGEYLQYDGASWTAPATADTTQIIESVSCPSATFCAADDNNFNGVTYDGTSWSQPTALGQANGRAISCASASFCVATGGQGLAVSYDGAGWGAPATIDGVNALLSVSCPSTAFCVAVDSAGNELTYR